MQTISMRTGLFGVDLRQPETAVSMKTLRKLTRVPGIPLYLTQQPSLRIAVLAQYKALLVQARHLFDPNSR